MSRVRKSASLVAALALVSTPLLALSAAAPALAAPGNPGVPSAPTVLFTEDFENGLSDGEVTLLTDYTGTHGETYTAEGDWAVPSAGNGFILDAQASDADIASAGYGNAGGYESLRQLAESLGAHNDSSSSDTNHAVSAYTGTDVGANLIEFATDPALDLAVQNRFLTFSVNVAAMNCNSAHPQLRFFLDDGVSEIPLTSAALDPCTDNTAAVRSTTLTADQSVLFTGSELGIVLRNGQGNGNGNDHAFDDIQVLDATPQLDKEFTPTSALTGGATPLTFTITNTSELAAKTGWSFTDTLPAGMQVAGPASSTCAAANVTAPVGSGEIVVENGSIAAGVDSCTVTVHVAGDTTGDFTNGPDNVETVGLDLPATSTLTVNDPAVPQLCSDTAIRATERFWFFGGAGGLDFGATGDAAPVAVPGLGTSAEGTTVITDSTGQLQFWSNGGAVVNRNQAVMPNGVLGSGVSNSSATQTVAAFPSTTQPGIFFVVTTTGAEGAAPGDLYYAIVDMSADGGLGDVTTSSSLIPGAAGVAGESLTAVPNADGTGYWVLTSQNNSPHLHAFYFDGSGPADPDGAGPLTIGDPVTSVMPTNNLNRYSSFVFSADRTQLVQTSTGGSSVSAPSIIRTLSFDAASGAMAQIQQWSAPVGADTGQGLYGADFSPSGRYLYVSKIFSGGQLYRYDLQASDIAASLETVGSIGGTGGAVRRGPDGRVYVAKHSETTLAVIGNPDAAALTDIDFDLDGQALPVGTSGRYGLPQMVTGCPSNPEMSIDKSSSLTTDTHSDGQGDVGDVITYTFTVRNTGTVDLTGVVPVDPMITTAFAPTSADIAAGGLQTFTATYTIAQADLDTGEIENTATVTGIFTPPNGDDPQTVTGGPDTDTFTPAPRVPGLAIVKAAQLDDTNNNGVADLDETIDYSFTVTNTGNVSMTGIVVNDPLVDDLAPASVDLAPGDPAAVFTASYVVTADDILTGEVPNSATASGTSPIGGYTSPPSTTSTDTADAEPGLDIVKTQEITTDHDGDDRGDADDVVTYTFMVTNTGNTVITGIAVDDPRVPSITPATVDLAPGDSATFSGTYTVTQADIDEGSLVNTATAIGTFTPPGGPGTPITSPPGSVTTILEPGVPGLTVVKSAEHNDTNGNGFAEVGEMIGYSFEITNTGNTTMENVSVIDPKVTGLDPAGVTLAPGDSIVITADLYSVTAADVESGSVLNTAVTRGNVPGGPESISDPSTVEIPVAPPVAGDTPTDGDALPQTGAGPHLSELLLLAVVLLFVGTLMLYAYRERNTD